jgi:hypothetical protein
MLRAAYESSTPRDPYLPPSSSPVPALLALRITHQTIQDTKACLSKTQADLTRAERRLEVELADLDDAHSLSRCLEGRIDSLRDEIQECTYKPKTQVAKDLTRDLKRKKANYDTETSKMVKAFNRFVDNHLASMLAAEELGGPVAGEILDIDELSLESGFSQHGNNKKHKVGWSEEKRQQRIDEIWGQRPTDDRKNNEPWDERRAAAAEMRELTERLLNNLVQSDAGDGDAYVELRRESAAARFLVRSKVAQFHPKDARRLRLMSFGRDLDD